MSKKNIIKCPNCGGINEGNVHFCEHCGKRLKHSVDSWKVCFFILATLSVVGIVFLCLIIKGRNNNIDWLLYDNDRLMSEVSSLEDNNDFLKRGSEPAQIHVMSSNSRSTVRFCNGVILDPGGTNYYYDNCDSYVVVSPDMPEYEHGIRIQGNYSTESGCDYFDVYEGATTGGKHLGHYSGSGECDILSPSGELLIHFHSDGSVVRSGFALSVSCVPPDYKDDVELPEGDGI